MSTASLFDTIQSATDIPRTELQALLKTPQETADFALGVMEEWLQKIPAGENDPDDQRPLFSMFLLAELKEPRAYPLFLRLLRLPNAPDEDVLGDVLTEFMPKFLAAVAGGDTAGLMTLALDTEADEFCRSAAVSAFLVQLNMGQHTRDEVVANFAAMFHKAVRRESFFWDTLIGDAVDLQATGLLREIGDAIEEGLPRDDYSLEELESVMSAPAEESFLQHPQNQPLGDWMSELESWSFEEPKQTPAVSTKVGRNDQCPCGSGKKYKKCHGA
jgi:hypothetical protein